MITRKMLLLIRMTVTTRAPAVSTVIQNWCDVDAPRRTYMHCVLRGLSGSRPRAGLARRLDRPLHLYHQLVARAAPLDNA